MLYVCLQSQQWLNESSHKATFQVNFTSSLLMEKQLGGFSTGVWVLQCVANKPAADTK